MKILQSSVFRAICAIAVGIMLIKYPDNTVTWITIAIGVLFLLSGIISMVAYYNALKHVSEYKITDAEGNVVAGDTKPTFPIVGVGSAILGLNQYMSLLNARRFGKIGFGYWIFPSVILLVGLFVIIKPLAPAEMAMLVLGWCSLLYGVTELINALKIHNEKRKFKKTQEIPVAEEIVEDTPTTASTTPAEDDSRYMPTVQE